MWCTVFHSEKCRGTHKHCLHVQPQRERCECISHEFIVAVRFNLDRHLISLYFARKIRNRFIETHANINGDAVDEAKTSEIRSLYSTVVCTPYAHIKTINFFLLNIKNSFEFPPLWITFTLCFFCFYANALYIVWTAYCFFCFSSFCICHT